MRAKRCDKCGAFYEPEKLIVRLQFIEDSKSGRSRSSIKTDLCMECQKAIKAWFDKPTFGD